MPVIWRSLVECRCPVSSSYAHIVETGKDALTCNGKEDEVVIGLAAELPALHAVHFCPFAYGVVDQLSEVGICRHTPRFAPQDTCGIVGQLDGRFVVHLLSELGVVVVFNKLYRTAFTPFVLSPVKGVSIVAVVAVGRGLSPCKIGTVVFWILCANVCACPLNAAGQTKVSPTAPRQTPYCTRLI